MERLVLNLSIAEFQAYRSAPVYASGRDGACGNRDEAPERPSQATTGDDRRRQATTGGGKQNMLTLQELSDRAEIQDLIVAEANAMDRQDWSRWQALFTPDALIDYSENDGAKGDPGEVRRWLESVLGRFHSYQHLSSNLEIDFDGDRARVRTLQYIAVKMETSEGERVVFSGIWFRDEVARTAEGWRINRRFEELAWRHNFPEDFQPPKAD
jgi:3-phenylpropionate/cinnamic acid dioxygenase small subunit